MLRLCGREATPLVEESTPVEGGEEGFFDPEGLEGEMVTERMSVIEARERKEKLLPWGFEQKFNTVINLCKVPLVLLVFVFGTMVERKVKASTMATWRGPACFSHKLDIDTWNDINNSWVKFGRSISEEARHTVTELIQNTSLEQFCDNGTHKCEVKIFDSSDYGLNFTTAADTCGIKPISPGVCDVDPELPRQDGMGLGWHIPYITHSFVWALFKILFLPVYPIDRIARNICACHGDHPEPVFKLLTEPYFLGGIEAVSQYVVLIFKYIRYILLPNSLIMPLLSMEVDDRCHHFLYYKHSWIARGVYLWLVFDIVHAFILWFVGMTHYKQRLVGTYGYWFYKIIWFCMSWIPFWFFLIDQLSVIDLRFWMGWNLVFKKVLTIHFDFTISIDLVRLLGHATVMLDCVSFSVMIAFIIYKAATVHPSSEAHLEKFTTSTLNWDDSQTVPLASSNTVPNTSSRGPPAGTTSRGKGK